MQCDAPFDKLMALSKVEERFDAPAKRNGGQARPLCGGQALRPEFVDGPMGCCSSVVEHVLGKDGVMGSNPISSSSP